MSKSKIDSNSFQQIVVDEDSDISTVWVVDLADRIGTDPYSLQLRLTNEELRELSGLVDLEKRVAYPMLWMAAVWIIVSIFALLRSSDIIVDFDKCSVGYWLCLIGIYPCLTVITLYISQQNMKQYTRKSDLYWMPEEGDITWTLRKAIIYPVMAAAAGFLGGFLGIGGGMIVSPMLLELGVLPRVASATSALAVLMTSSSSTFQKVLLKMLRYDFMAFYMVLGVVGTLIGQTVVNVAIKKYGRNSIVVFAVSSVIGIAIILMGVNSVTSMDWNMTPQSLCG